MQNRDLWNKTDRPGRGPGIPWTIEKLDISKGPDDFGPMLAAKLRYNIPILDLGKPCVLMLKISQQNLKLVINIELALNDLATIVLMTSFKSHKNCCYQHIVSNKNLDSCSAKLIY